MPAGAILPRQRLDDCSACHEWLQALSGRALCCALWLVALQGLQLQARRVARLVAGWHVVHVQCVSSWQAWSRRHSAGMHDMRCWVVSTKAPAISVHNLPEREDE